jgi:hypothetical protein
MAKRPIMRRVINSEYLPTTFPWHIVFIAFLICDKLNSQAYWYIFYGLCILLLLVHTVRVFTEVSEHPSKINQIDQSHKHY